MNCHQILSGACNAGDRCFAVGSVEGVPFTAYAAGCNIVILASNFERVQIIPGVSYGYIKISAIDCSTDTGKIAAAYESKIFIFEPTPVLPSNSHSKHMLDYRWVETGSLVNHSNVITLSWNLEGTRLLTGGTTIQLWKEISTNTQNEGVKFVIGSDKENKCTQETAESTSTWENIWSCQTAIPLQHMAFSPDGTLFATCGRSDRLVKIWYESKQFIFPSHHSAKDATYMANDGETRYTYVYIAHPRAVTSITWRKTSKYMPKGSVSNMLVTSCLDNISRVWIETILPDDGLINMTQYDPLASKNPKFRTHRHKHRFMQRLKHMKACFHIRRHVKNNHSNGAHASIANRTSNNYLAPIPSLPSSCSVHDFHSYGFHGAGITQGMHFHLAASINAETDIPLVPTMQCNENSSAHSNFVLHWLNNKEMNFTLQAEVILQELTKKVIEEENGIVGSSVIDRCDAASECATMKHRNIMSIAKSLSADESNSIGDHGDVQNMNSMSNTTSYTSLNNDHQISLNQLTDSLDIKIDCLLRDWHQGPDLFFAIHPVDGSFLIWVVEWLDDYQPGSFRQAQVSFSTRIPSAFPLGDSMSMSTMVSLYNTGTYPLALRDITNNLKRLHSDNFEEENMKFPPTHNPGNKISSQLSKESGNDVASSISPTVSLVTKHLNGTLNLWQLSFSHKTKFTQVLSIGHVSRVSGHRFRVNDITCHPVLPLLVSASHHNLSEVDKSTEAANINQKICAPSGFCSELILWRVDSVGPLCHMGGISELARINSPAISAFSNVAWIPTLLPSTTLGTYSNSSSACFVASDGENLRVYQAVIDARTLLAEISSSETVCNLCKSNSVSSLYSNGSSAVDDVSSSVHDKLKIVSQQSTARPGCIIQLDAISDARHDWQNTQFLHVFQAQLITGNDASVNKHATFKNKSRCDVEQSDEFEEPFYIVIIEKTLKGSTFHMWRIVISSKQKRPLLAETAMYVPDTHLTQDIEEIETVPRTGESMYYSSNSDSPHICIATEKVCVQDLPLPDGVDVVHASPAAGHLSSASIYPACYAPYIIVTACSDSICRFWKCSRIETNENGTHQYVWSEWKMLSRQQNSAVDVPGQLLNVSAAYSGRIACAYKYGKSFTRPNKGGSNDSRFINLCVGIYECESTGGSEWILEDTIHLKNINLPRINLEYAIDFSYLQNSRIMQRKQRLNQVLNTLTAHEEMKTVFNGETFPENSGKSSAELLAVPSFSTLQSLRRNIFENGNTCPLTQKHLVQLDWVSKEEGSHILTVAVGSKILLYTAVSSDIAQANIKAMKESQSANRPMLRKMSSLAQPHFNDDIRWMKLRQIDLKTADGLLPLPMQISWVRDGILVVAMDSEMHVYSQWKPRYLQQHSVDDLMDKRNLCDDDLRSIMNDSSKVRIKSMTSIPLISKSSTANLSNEKKRKLTNISAGYTHNGCDDYLTDFGLFQASRIACPVLPQYHPKQLMELLNCGKMRWVKAILAHLVRSLSGTNPKALPESDDDANKQMSWTRSRTLSLSFTTDTNIQIDQKRGSITQIPEELMLDYTEITSIPPLPLWVLLNADNETTTHIRNNLTDDTKCYDRLFEMTANDESLDDLLGNEDEYTKGDRSLPEKQITLISHFGPRQGQMLSRLLTHTHLPGLSSLDQMHLLALADTVSTCNTDFSEKFIPNSGKGLDDSATDVLDDCGLRFLLAMKHFNYLLRCLPLNQRAQYQKNGIGTENIVWAFHSESEEELLNLIPSYRKGNLKWSLLRDLGVGYWLRSINVLRQCVEKLAKCAYQVKQDPLDAALYYLAMKKKSIVWGLFRSKRDEKMAQFFSNNFTENRWRKAALKNAFVLLGKQRFEHAVAFFLLADSLNDAIEVCLNKLDDFQLALVITRLYEGVININVMSSYRKLLCEYILGCDIGDVTNADISKAHPDPFLRSMAYWILTKYHDSLGTLLINGVGENHLAYQERECQKEENHSTNPNIFNFYIYLRTHPLLLRQNLALTAREKKLSNVILSGFSYAGDNPTLTANDKQLLIEDTITSVERQLYFTTAHAHFKAGCAALALEVLNKLPTKILDVVEDNVEKTSGAIDTDNELIKTGIMEWNASAAEGNSANMSTAVDWSLPVERKADEFKIEWSDDDSLHEEEDRELANTTCATKQNSSSLNLNSNESAIIDVMAQQLKFIACLKILMEELSTLSTGFEVDGGHLRYQLYVWLEKEVEALKYLCNYCNSEADDNNKEGQIIEDENNVCTLSERPTLHEILIYEKKDFEAKVKRAAKRKKWLKANETLLRTLLSYCSLHGANGGGLASVKMELVLLLQELQQEKTQQQLLSPLPFPTTLPLLSACVAGNKTVIADPIKYLQSQTIDILQSIIGFTPFAAIEMNSFSEIFILRDLSVALSSCIYQCLCDSDSFVRNVSESGYQSPGIENIAKLNSEYECTHLIDNANLHRRKMSSAEEATVKCASPSKWPGVANLRALLAQEKDEDIPKLNVLLLESFVATYISLAIYALVTCDCRILFRLVAHNFTVETWFIIFGGGIKKLLRKPTSETVLSQELDEDNQSLSHRKSLTSITKQRIKLNMKILGSHAEPTRSDQSMKEDKPTFREKFVSPEMSMLSYFLTKPDTKECDDYDTDDAYDSEEDENEEDVDADLVANDAKELIKENLEHSNTTSFSWCVLRLALIQTFLKNLQDFINISGIETQDLPVLSPLTHEVIRTLNHWKETAEQILLVKKLSNEGNVPDCFICTPGSGTAVQKYKSLLNRDNIPFVQNTSAGPITRLWNYLLRQEHTQDIFTKIIFGKRCERVLTEAQRNETLDTNDCGDVKDDCHIRVIHKDHESVLAFCLNNHTSAMIAVANPREVQELDISLLLESPYWYEDEYDMFDVSNVSRDSDSTQNTGFLVIQAPEQSQHGSSINAESNVNFNNIGLLQSGRGTEVILKHKIDNVKRMSSHPLMPLYLTGGQDGSVQIWEWGHQQVVCTPRPSGTFAKVTRCRFSEQGNKFGIGDGDGNLSLWQTSMASQNNKSFFNYQCHNKTLTDFAFLGSCSFLATAGQSSENKNFIMWDTLLPQKKSCITAFTCHDQGAACFVFAPQHQLIISCGKKGDICVFDVRQRTLKHRFQAHDNTIKSIALDPYEEYFATGSIEGDIKIWGLNQFSLITTFPTEHTKNSFFKHIGQGVSQIYIDGFGRLFSCGSDGCMKVRQLFDRDEVVSSVY